MYILFNKDSCNWCSINVWRPADQELVFFFAIIVSFSSTQKQLGRLYQNSIIHIKKKKKEIKCHALKSGQQQQHLHFVISVSYTTPFLDLL